MGDQFKELDAFIEVLNSMPSKPRNNTLNLKRAKELWMAYKAITEIVLPISPDAKIEYGMHEDGTGSAVIRVEADEIIVEDIKTFISGVENASNFEIYPLTNGNIKMGILFRNVMN